MTLVVYMHVAWCYFTQLSLTQLTTTDRKILWKRNVNNDGTGSTRRSCTTL